MAWPSHKLRRRIQAATRLSGWVAVIRQVRRILDTPVDSRGTTCGKLQLNQMIAMARRPLEACK